MRITLVIGADNRVRRLVTLALRHGEFDVRVVADVSHAAGVLRRRQVRGIVVSGRDPIDVGEIADLRSRTDVAIVVVCERAESADRVAILDAGADESVTFPFEVDELLARYRACLRRADQPYVEERPVETEDFTIYLADRKFVFANGTEAPLSPTEWKLVEVLARRSGHLVSQEEILRTVWGPDATAKLGLLRVHMASIRRKVEPEPGRPRYFVTAPGLGIRFTTSSLEARDSAS